MRQLRIVGGLAIVLLACVYTASAQTTTVTATVKDPNGNPYALGTASAFIVLSLGQPLPAGALLTTGPVTTNAAGLFTLVLFSPAAYQFTVCAPPVGLGPLANPTPTQVCFSSGPIAISGASQDLSVTLNAISRLLGPQGAAGVFTGPLNAVGGGSLQGTFTGGPSFQIAASPTGATESGNIATFTTTAPCTFVSNQAVVVTGVGVAGYNNDTAGLTNPNAWQVLSPGCNGGSSFTAYNPTSGLAASGGGTVVGTPLFTGGLTARSFMSFGTGTGEPLITPFNHASNCGSSSSYVTLFSQALTPCNYVSMYYGAPQQFNGFGQFGQRTVMKTLPGTDVQSAAAHLNLAVCDGNNSVGFANDNKTNCLGEVVEAISDINTASVNPIGLDVIAQSVYTGSGTHTVQASQLLTNAARGPVWANNPNGDYSSGQTNLVQGGSQNLTLGLGVDSSAAGKGFLVGSFDASTINVGHAIIPGTVNPDTGVLIAAGTTYGTFIGANTKYTWNAANQPAYANSPTYGEVLGEKAANSGASNVLAFFSTNTGTSCTLNAATESSDTITYTCNAAISGDFAVGSIAHVTGVTPSGYNIDCEIQTVASPSFTCKTSNYNLGAGTVFGTAVASTRQAFTHSFTAAGGFNLGFASPPSGAGTTKWSFSPSNTDIDAFGSSSTGRWICTTACQFGTTTATRQDFLISGAPTWSISTGGVLGPLTDGADDLGATVTLRPNNGFFKNNVTVGGALLDSGVATATLSGTGACATFSGQVGGELAGSAACASATAASTLTIGSLPAAAHGYSCNVQDETTRANLFQQTGHTTTSCTLTVTSVTQNDVFVFTAVGF